MDTDKEELTEYEKARLDLQFAVMDFQRQSRQRLKRLNIMGYIVIGSIAILVATMIYYLAVSHSWVGMIP
jgi:hypothetical protein